MLFLNNEWINLGLSESDSPAQHKPYIAEWNQFLKECADFKFPVILKLKRYNVKINKSGHIEPTPATCINLSSVTNGAAGTESWVYQKTFPVRGNSGQYIWREKSEWIRGSMIVHENQKDKLFFLMKKSPYLKTKVLYHYDPELIARQKAEKRRLETEVAMLIYSPTSPLVQNHDMMRVIAKSFGIAKVDSISISEIQERLESKVKSGDDVTTKGAKAFLDACNYDESVKNRAKIQEAVDKGIIRYTPSKKEWVFINKDGVVTRTICKTEGKPGDEIKELYNHLKNDESSSKLILSGGAVDTNVSAEDVDNMPWEDARALAEACGIRTVAVKKEKILDDLRAYLLTI